MKKIHYKIYYIVSFSLVTAFAVFAAVAAVAALPAYASVATIYFQSSRTTIPVGDTAVVSVKIDAGGAVLNSVAGSVGLTFSSDKPAVTVQQFSLANSVFGLWPRTPSLSATANGDSISFVGGVPGGFSIEGATLFDIIVTATSTGSVTISPQDISVFANDGKGTVVPAQLKNLSITVVPRTPGTPVVNDWTNIVSNDTTPPEPFIIVLGQDPAIFNGQKFAFFSAVDNQSGIDHYEVSEDGKAYVRSGSTYVLQDQTDPVHLAVVAYDKAGNSRMATYPAGATSQIPLWMTVLVGVLLVVVICVAYAIGRKISRKMSKKHNVPKNLHN